MSKSTSHVVYPSEEARCEELEPAVIQWTLTKSLCVTLPKRLLLCVSGTEMSVWSGLRSASQSRTPSGTTQKAGTHSRASQEVHKAAEWKDRGVGMQAGEHAGTGT